MSLDRSRRALVVLAAALKRRRAADGVLRRRATGARRRRFLALLERIAAAYSASKPRVIQRNDGGWSSSTIYNYAYEGDEATCRRNFRVTRATLQLITDLLSSKGYVTDNNSKSTPSGKRQTAKFKVAVCMYYLAVGGETRVVGDAAGIGRSTVERYLDQFCTGVFNVLRPRYMPSRLALPQCGRRCLATRRPQCRHCSSLRKLRLRVGELVGDRLGLWLARHGGRALWSLPAASGLVRGGCGRRCRRRHRQRLCAEHRFRCSAAASKKLPVSSGTQPRNDVRAAGSSRVHTTDLPLWHGLLLQARQDTDAPHKDGRLRLRCA